MDEVIKCLIDFMQKYGVTPEIKFKNDIGCMWLFVYLNKNKKKISNAFYFVPVGDGTYENFKNYNPDFEQVIVSMVKELLEVSE